MALPLDLTIAIPVRNEERNLPGCLKAIGKDLAQKIVVIDSGSTDNTKKISSDFGVGLLDFKWDGNFPKKRNWFLINHTPATKWVMFIDADEYLTNDFKSELRKALSNDNKVGYWLSYTIFFLGKKLKGGYPLRKLALFQVGAGRYERIDEKEWSTLDMEIHEHPVLQGKTGLIRSRIDHKEFEGVSNYIIKHSEYAGWEASRFLSALANEDRNKNWTWKQKLKYRLMRTVWIGPAYFLGSFFLLGGFRDGARGLAFAIFKMSYFTQIYCRLKEDPIK